METEVDGRKVRLTNLDKPLYPSGFTKGQVIDYYARIAPAILPHLRGRALSLRRFPDGADAEGFFEKRCPSHAPDWVATASVDTGGRAGTIEFCVCDDRPTLIWLAQLAALELHPYLALAAEPDRPTVVAFDLDPGAPAGMAECAKVGLRVREALEGIDLECHPKTSGGKGLQVYAPIEGAESFDETKSFARAVAQALERSTPDLVVSSMARAKRRGKVLVDWSQNDRNKTTVCAWSLRARERPTVSTPVSWEEVEAAAEGEGLSFEAAEALERFDAEGDPFAPVLEGGGQLP